MHVRIRRSAKQIADAMTRLAKTDVLVGIPADKTGRRDTPITSAALGFIHEYGSPAANIPPRPFLIPGIRAAAPRTTVYLAQAAKAAMDGNAERMERAMHAAGLAASVSVQSTIRAGISPPLQASTVAGRRRRSAGSSYRRKASAASQVTPLIDTGQLLASITYALRERKR